MSNDRARRAEIDREIIKRKGFAEFVRRAWSIVEPTQRLIWNWHIDEMCTHAEAMVSKTKDDSGAWAVPELRKLVCNIPPAHMKTVIWCILWPAYVWTYRPEYRWLFASYHPDVSNDTAERFYLLITSLWYRERWGDILRPARGRHAMGDFWTKAGGRRFSTTVGGPATGVHADAFVVDDPIKASAAQSMGSELSAVLENANRWHGNTVASRGLNPEAFVKVVVMQRLHENDLAGQCVDQGYTHLSFAAKYVAADACRTPWGGDRRTVEGELLFPARFPLAELNEIAKGMLGWDGPVACAQLQQQPAPPGGLIFKKETFKGFSSLEIPIGRTVSALSIDCNFKKADVNSDVGFAVGGILAPRMYMYEAKSLNIGFNDTLKVSKELVKLHRPTAIIVEDKALGPALIELLRKDCGNVIPILPLDSKEARAHGANTYYQAGSVYHSDQMVGFPSKPTDPPGGRAGFEQALSVFPRGRKKDVIDALTQLIWYLASQDYSRLLGALNALDDESNGNAAFKAMFKIGS